ncbi:MAG: hypothetical protein QOJ38_199 [Solirubrobacterales bacterium]|jgi:hypothetical protein|nr:hypothetical protein [Solirubrobacterales bacterium]
MPFTRRLLVVLAALLALAGAASAASAATSTGSWHPDVAAAKRYAESRSGSVRFAFIGLSGHLRGFHAGQTAPLASVFKVMLLATYLRQPSVRHRELTSKDRDLLDPMIRRSDNNAATKVRDIVGRKAIERLARDAEMKSFSYNQVWGLSRTNASDQASFMDRLDDFVPARHRAYARKLLSSIVDSQSWGVGKVPHDGWKLYFKGGWGSGSGRVDHQVAFLERGEHRIALAIFTEFDPSHDYGKRTLRGVAARLLKGLPADL